MAYIYGNRNQMNLMPKCIEDYVASDDSVRAYDAFVESIDLAKLEIIENEVRVGNNEYNPKAMIKLLVYGYSYGIRSSRKLERASLHNISFIWLTGGLKPDYRTIARFRKNHKKELKNIFKQCARLCIKLNLIEGNTLFVDGSKIRANAGIKNTWNKAKCKKHLKKIDERIENILQECDDMDASEANNESLVKLDKELKNKEVLKAKVKSILTDIEDEEKKSINSTDKECVNGKSRQGNHALYNAQLVSDDKHGLIVNSDVANKNNDYSQFANQIEQANENLNRKCKTACGDKGYANTDELKKIDDQNINVVVPFLKQACEEKAFNKDQFEYDEQDDCYICSEGHKLKFSSIDLKSNKRFYRINSRRTCKTCKHFGVCTTAQKGRTISRLTNEETNRKLKEQYNTEESQTIYKRRKEKIEHPFGHIKRNLGVGAFLMRGLDGVKAEMSLLSTCFNIARMITIVGGVQKLIEQLNNL
jgi:transposase